MKICKIEGCDRTNKRGYLMRGMCDAHYMRFRRGTDLSTPMSYKRVLNRTCSIDGCEHKHHAKGYCSTHYTRYLRHNDALAIRTPRCNVNRCERPAFINELCIMHEKRRAQGKPLGTWRNLHEEWASFWESFEDIEWGYSTEELKNMSGLKYRTIYSNLCKRGYSQEKMERFRVQANIEDMERKRRSREQRKASAKAS